MLRELAVDQQDVIDSIDAISSFCQGISFEHYSSTIRAVCYFDLPSNGNSKSSEKRMRQIEQFFLEVSTGCQTLPRQRGSAIASLMATSTSIKASSGTGFNRTCPFLRAQMSDLMSPASQHP